MTLDLITWQGQKCKCFMIVVGMFWNVHWVNNNLRLQGHTELTVLSPEIG